MFSDNSSICARSPLRCLICDHPTKNANYGAIACRACANFFKRTIVLGKQYVCMRNEDMCNIRRDQEFLCRRCRFDKCVDAGMQLPISLIPSGSSSINDVKTSAISLMNKGHGLGYLQRISREYQASFDRRLKSERAMLHSNYAKIDAPNGQPFYVSTIDLINESCCASIEDIGYLVTSVFPQVTTLTPQDQMSLLKSFAAGFLTMEGNYLTDKFFRGISRYFVISPATFMDMERPEIFVHAIGEGQKDLAKAIRFYSKKSIGLTRPILQETQFTETEFHAALCLLMWSFDSLPSVPDRLVDIGNTMRRRILEELSYYYRNEMKCLDFASRLGRIMLFVHAVQEATIVLQEEFQTYRIMGVIDEGNQFMKLIL